MPSFREATLEIGPLKRQILSKISFHIFPGDFILLLGGNGSGKSSLLKLINGLCLPTHGDILFQGKSFKSVKIHKRSQSIATLTQDLNFSTFSDLTVFENCLIAIDRTKTNFFSKNRVSKEYIFEHLNRFHPSLAKRISTKTGSLSGGERQILAFALMLFSTPKLLLLDEHTSALDPDMAHKLMEATHKTVTEKQITTLMTTHNLEHALQYGNRIIALKGGKILLDTREKLSKTNLLSLYA